MDGVHEVPAGNGMQGSAEARQELDVVKWRAMQAANDVGGNRP